MQSLTPEQVVLIGLIASLLTVVYKWIVNKTGWLWLKGKLALTIVVSVLSIVLAVLFAPPVIPPLAEDFWAFLGGLVSVLSAYLGFATLIYNVFFTALKDLYEWVAAKLA
jgi:hypothetical protein